MTPVRPDWLSVRRYATVYGIHRTTVTRYLLAGRLEIWQVGKTIRIRNVPPNQHQPRSSAAVQSAS
jgi:hypothetical protein